MRRRATCDRDVGGGFRGCGFGLVRNQRPAHGVEPARIGLLGRHLGCLGDLLHRFLHRLPGDLLRRLLGRLAHDLPALLDWLGGGGRAQ